MHIAGSIFIFNISKGQRPVSDLEKHISEPPQLVQGGVFHPLGVESQRLGPSPQSRAPSPKFPPSP
jgi:hypothetical protein